MRSTDRSPRYARGAASSARPACSWSKAADVNAAPPLTPGELTNAEARQQILHLGLAGLGIGAGAGALSGLRDFVTRRSPIPAGRRLGGLRPAVIQVGTPEPEEEERRPALKAAADAAPAVTPMNPLEAPASQVAKMPADWSRPTGGAGSGLMRWLSGKDEPDIWNKPWVAPAATAAVGAGLYGGYKGVTGLLELRRKSDREKELDDAKKEYRDALMSQYAAGGKYAAAPSPLAAALDELAGMSKEAIGAGGVAGGYLAMAGLLAGGAGLGTYAYVKSHAPESRLAKAIQQRERLRWSTHPPEIYAVGKPTPMPDEEEDGNKRLGGQLSMPPADVASLYRK